MYEYLGREAFIHYWLGWVAPIILSHFGVRHSTYSLNNKRKRRFEFLG